MYTITIKTISYRYITETKCEKSSFEYIVQKQWKYLFDLRVEKAFPDETHRIQLLQLDNKLS